jgi:hypothetical protein
MSDPAAIRGTFADFRLIKGRKVAQMVVEIPIEEADAALATLGGLPQPAAERWVALAALNVTSIKPQEKRRFEDLKSAMQAGIRCADPPFWKFLTEQYADNDVVSNLAEIRCADEAAKVVRNICGVASRSNLNLDPRAAAKWQELDAYYMLWLREPQHA